MFGNGCGMVAEVIKAVLWPQGDVLNTGVYPVFTVVEQIVARF